MEKVHTRINFEAYTDYNLFLVLPPLLVELGTIIDSLLVP